MKIIKQIYEELREIRKLLELILPRLVQIDDRNKNATTRR